MQSQYLDTLRKRILIYDGAMGTSVQARNLSPDDFGGKDGCNDYLVLTRPEVIEEIHESFMAVGCDVLETDTFGGSRPKLDEYGLGERTRELNIVAAQLARRVADRHATPDRPRFVAGSLGPTGFLPSSDDPSLGKITFEELAAIFREQAAALIAGGVDLLLIETAQDILEVKAAIFGCRAAMADEGRRVPVQAQVTLDTSGRMLLGTDIDASMVTLEALGVDVIGLNCSTGPEHMREPVRALCERCPLPISVIPNAGLPRNEGGRAVYPLEPEPMARQLLEFARDFGVSAVGGCCGTTPEHLARVVELCRDLVPKVRRVERVPRLSSAIRATPMMQEPPPALVGERVNTLGSRRVKRLLLNDDYDTVLTVARDQVEGGAHLLDVCVAMTERADEAVQMRTLVKKLAMTVETPLVIDTTEADVARAALAAYPGRALINSVNMENGRVKLDNVLPLARDHGAAVVCMTIDERGMAKTAERKVEVARRIHEIACGEYGLPPDALVFDTQTFPLGTGQEDLLDSAVQTIEGIREIERQLPGVMSVLGISNISFGLAPHSRPVLNSVFLYHSVEAGLDMAIVHPAEVIPYMEIPGEQRELAEDLIFNRRPDALARFTDYYQQHGPTAGDEPAEDPLDELTAEQRIHYRILHRKKDGVEADIDEALTRKTPVEVLNDVLLPAMKDVGDRFGAGELILPFVLQSAEVMKKSVAHLEQFLEKKEGYTKGKVVLATVYGDVHDIGKNLVNTILTNNGYTVFDLGKQVPLNAIIDKAVEVQADAIGLSALLVSTSKQMPLCVQELHKRELGFPVVVGGAAINKAYGQRILFVDEGQETPYAPGVFYAKDAFEGLEIMDALMSERRDSFLDETVRQARAALGKQRPTVPNPASVAPTSDVDRNVPPPTLPFWGTRVLEGIAMEKVFRFLALRSLFRLQWGAKSVKGDDWVRLLKDDFMPRLRAMQRDAMVRGWLQPRATYGYYPAAADGDDLLVFDPADRERVLQRFHFPRQPAEERLCISDYFAPVETGRRDLVAFQVVTVGSRATELVDELQARGDYSEAYFTHGLGVESAEALAEYVHRHINKELGLPRTRGKRYSWGYPACPDLEDHAKAFALLPEAEQIGVGLTEGYQLVPEQSTVAIIAHHPQAKYFSARVSPRSTVAAR